MPNQLAEASNAGSPFTQAQQQWLRNFSDDIKRSVDDAVRAALAGIQPARTQSQSSSQPARTPSVPTPTYEDHIKPTEIGFFYPNVTTEWTSDSTITKDGKTYYRSLPAFVDRVQALAVTRNAAAIRQTLELCLRGEAESWWNEELDNISRISIVQSQNGVDEWCKALENRFKDSPLDALNKLNSLKYTMTDAQKRRSPSAYMAEVIAAAKACGYDSDESAFVPFAWNRIDIRLRNSIDEPAPGTSVATFMETLRRKQANWFDEAAQAFIGQDRGANSGFRDRQEYCPWSTNWSRKTQSRGMNFNANASQPYGSNDSSIKQVSFPTRGSITSGNEPSGPQNQLNQEKSKRAGGQYQRNTQKAQHADVRDEDDEDCDPDNQEANWNDTIREEDLNDSNRLPEDDKFDEKAWAFNGWVEKASAPVVCNVCDKGFVSINQLHQHIRTEHTAKACEPSDRQAELTFSSLRHKLGDEHLEFVPWGCVNDMSENLNLGRVYDFSYDNTTPPETESRPNQDVERSAAGIFHVQTILRTAASKTDKNVDKWLKDVNSGSVADMQSSVDGVMKELWDTFKGALNELLPSNISIASPVQTVLKPEAFQETLLKALNWKLVADMDPAQIVREGATRDRKAVETAVTSLWTRGQKDFAREYAEMPPSDVREFGLAQLTRLEKADAQTVSTHETPLTATYSATATPSAAATGD
ncbi:hypothetical protein AYL99_11717 [Fonsecaea erecta]|uniref:C2H2-type domain-containing protein n=1 Tax=Fonsecaea erecta TaxID=1367422 RepID=A0A178Z330_9EURO|nr:hypothetical protein AYL99_11717 [Fonsecaea erecta]OAP54182.1 hypothetical protein AYL99_11717 [Fonsecaea erecta]